MNKNISDAIKNISVVLLFIAISALIISAVLDNSVFDNSDITGQIDNETLLAVDNITNSTFAIVSTYSDATCNLDNIYNTSGGEIIIGDGNYTYYTDCKLILQDDSPYIGEDLNVSYDYTYSSGSNSAGFDVSLLGTAFGGFVTGIIAFFSITGILIGILFLIRYVIKLFGKEEGLGNISA